MAHGGEHRRGYLPELVLWGLTVFWGTTFVVVKDALAHADTLSFLFLRFLLGALTLAPFIGRREYSGEILRWGTGLGALLFLGFVLQTAGLEETSPAQSAFITGLCVILVPLLSAIGARQRPPAAVFVAALTSCGGLLLLTGAWTFLEVGRGAWLTLGCAVAFTFHILGTSRCGQLAARPLVAVQLATVAVLSGVAWPLGPRRFDGSAALWLAIVVCGVLASALAISLQTWAQTRSTAARAALIFSAEPVCAALVSAALGRERLDAVQWAGGGMMVASVLLCELWLSRRRPSGVSP